MNPRFIISGGGTGGHIFPAVSIAGEIKRRLPEAEVLFVGAKGGMEETVVQPLQLVQYLWPLLQAAQPFCPPRGSPRSLQESPDPGPPGLD